MYRKYNMNPAKVTYNPDGTIDYDGGVLLYNIDNGKIPFKFNVVNGYFYCDHNNLTTLEGAPREVHGYFSCDHNNLTTLEGGPSDVSGDFFCGHNSLTDLKGAPVRVRGSFECHCSSLQSINGCPEYLGDIFTITIPDIDKYNLREQCAKIFPPQKCVFLNS